MKRREVPIEELWLRPAVTVAEAGRMTGYSRMTLYSRMDDGIYRWSYAGRNRMIVTASLREAEEKLAADRPGSVFGEGYLK